MEMEMLTEQILNGQSGAQEAEVSVIALSDLQLSLIGGGIGDVQI